MKNYAKAIMISFLIYPTISLADSSGIGVTLPGMSSSYGQDSIRAGDLDCKNSIGGATNLEFGVTGVVDNYQSPFGGGNFDPTRSSERDIGVYARITIPLDKPKERINCNSLYQLELRKKRLEVLKLQQELEALKRLNASGESEEFEN
jgi:hypothetical protein|tara:strand:+ start:6791 stop:7234 length:444 start_codon:yes stop_codon:yes gene_type:complete